MNPLRGARDSSISNFIAAMSHELRTPLNAIIGFSDLLAMDSSENTGEETYQEYVRHINDSGKLLLSMTDEVLSMSRLESVDYRFDIRRHKFRELVAKILGSYKYKTNGTGISIDFIVDESVPEFLYLDPLAFQYLIGNLLSNSIKAVSRVSGRITFATRIEENAEIVFEVEDNGPGMPEDLIERVGQPFMLKEGSYHSKDSRVDNGLGLYICHKMAKARGCKLEIDSQEGVGTVARIRGALDLFDSEQV